MDEFTTYRYIKKIMGYGVPKSVALEIMKVVKDNDNVEYAIHYSLQLLYGLNFKKLKQ